MKTTKKVLALLLCAVLLVSATVAGTVAWLTAKSDTVKNVFSVGNVDVSLYEEIEILDANGNKIGSNVDNYEGFEFKDILPGYQMKKVITVQNDGTTDAYVRVELKHNNFKASKEAIEDPIEEKLGKNTSEANNAIQAMYNDVFNDWGITYLKQTDAAGKEIGPRGTCSKNNSLDDQLLRVDMVYQIDNYVMFDCNNWFKSTSDSSYWNDNADNTYYADSIDADEQLFVYYLYLQAGETYDLIQGVNCPVEFNNEQMEMFDGLNIDATAYAIQAGGFYEAGDSSPADGAKRAFTELAKSY